MRLTLAIAGAIACAAGICFLVAAAALWLAQHYGPLTSDLVMGIVLLIVGGIVVGVLIAARDKRSSERQTTAERIFDNLAGGELQGLAMIFENRPLLASALALVLGLEKGMRKSRRST